MKVGRRIVLKAGCSAFQSRL